MLNIIQDRFCIGHGDFQPAGALDLLMWRRMKKSYVINSMRL